MDIVWSPIGLDTCVFSPPLMVSLVGGEVVVLSEKEPQIFGRFFAVCHLVYRTRPPPRPP